MQEIEIKITINRETEAVYRFSSFPVLIGRSEECDLSICHETVPRKLCKVWPDKHGQIHLEENPGLTNPLFESGKVVQNGVIKSSVSARIGPIGLEIQHASANKLNSDRPSLPRRTRVMLLGAAALVSIMASSLFFTNPASLEEVDATDFPEAIPFPPTAETSSVLPVDTMMQLAQTEYMRLPADIGRQREAVAMMRHAGISAKPDSPIALQAITLATRWEQSMNAAYRLEILTLFSAISREDVDAIRESAGRLVKYLGNSDAPIIEWLNRLLGKDSNP